MNENSTDQEIVLGLSRGQRDAWQALCERFGARLWKYVARLVGSDEEAVADVFQETMLAVAQAGRRLDPQRTSLWAWLATIGHNQAALYWRRAYRRPITDAGIAEASGSDDPVEMLNRHETVVGVRLLLADMPADYVVLLTAKYLDDLTIAEIVTLVGGTTEGVRSKLARARREFRERYERVAPVRSNKATRVVANDE